MKYAKILALILSVCMIMAACGDGKTSSDNTDSAASVTTNDQYVDESGELVNIGSPTTMKITPEEVGKLENPVVTGLETWMTDSRLQTTVALREQAYGIKYEYDTCSQDQRMAKWISAYVSGDAYDVLYINASEFPMVAQKGLVHPLEKIMPVYDPNYFNQAVTNAFSWKGRVYAANDAQTGVDTFGVFYNDTLFQNAGETTPLELYESGAWTWSAFENLIKAFHDVSGASTDIYGLAGSYDFIARSAIVSNGGAVITYTNDGADITLSNPKTSAAIDWTNKIRNFNIESRPTFLSGQAAMYVERLSQMNQVRLGSDGYEFGWVPFPNGPSGTGEQAGNVDGWCIGKGAKNIAGAVAWIAAGNYYETWAEENNIVVDDQTLTEEEIARGEEASALGRMDNYKGFGISVYGVLEDSKVIGTAASIEKHLPTLQAKVNEMLGIVSEVGAIDFENQGVITFESEEDYPFENVIGDDKFTYATADATSLNIDLSGMTEFGAILHTKPELYKLQTGGQYKVTFKFYTEADVGQETFAIAARRTDALTSDPTFGITWLNIKPNVTNEVEAYININDTFNGELAIVLLGSATENNPNLTIVIDDFNVELV